MPESANGVEVQDTAQKGKYVLEVALELYSRNPPPDWATFFRKILGLNGVVRQVFRTPEEVKAFEQSPEYTELQLMLSHLRERTVLPEDPKEPTRVITVRLPKSLHEALRAEAHEHQTSMNKLCISKLIQFIDSQTIPRERWKRVAERPGETPPPKEGKTEPTPEGNEAPALKGEEEAGADL